MLLVGGCVLAMRRTVRVRDVHEAAVLFAQLVTTVRVLEHAGEARQREQHGQAKPQPPLPRLSCPAAHLGRSYGASAAGATEIRAPTTRWAPKRPLLRREVALPTPLAAHHSAEFKSLCLDWGVGHCPKSKDYWAYEDDDD
jgi:hypothetical protein